MTAMKHLWGLPMIEPSSQTVGACLAVGRKPAGGGWPIEKNMFHVVTAKTRERKERGRAVDYRPHDPRFSAYNGADKETRTVFYGVLCYHLEEECWHPGYLMHRFPKGRGVNPKTSRGACHGNGQEAERFFGEGDVRTIECPGEGCPFRQPMKSGDTPPCMPRARFWFRPRWVPSQGKEFARWMPDGSTKPLLERPIMRLATQGREARDTFAGMLKDVRDAAEPLGIEISSWVGLPFSITLSETRQAAGVHPGENQGRRWPDITFALDGDWMEWIGWQAKTFRQLAEAPPVLALGSASDAELDPEEFGAEHLSIVPNLVKPAAVAGPSEKDTLEADIVEAPEPSSISTGEKIRLRALELWGEKKTDAEKIKLRDTVTAALDDADLIDSGDEWWKLPDAKWPAWDEINAVLTAASKEKQ